MSHGRRGVRSRWFWPAVGLATGGAVVLVVALVAGGGSSAAPASPGALVTTFMPGEIQQVPSACRAVPAALLDQYMPGRSAPAAAQPLEGKSASQCSWTMDDPRRYRFMEVMLEAYAPSGLASGNGSATQAAQDAFVAAKAAKEFPPRRSRQPKAQLTELTGLGQEAFGALQRYDRRVVLDTETVIVRDHNVLVTVIFETRVGGANGPADPVTLQAGAQAVARAALGAVR